MFDFFLLTRFEFGHTLQTSHVLFFVTYFVENGEVKIIFWRSLVSPIIPGASASVAQIDAVGEHAEGFGGEGKFALS
jgi:hypothetical protein